MGNCLQRSRRGGGEHCAKKSTVWVEEEVMEREEEEEARKKSDSAPASATAAATEVKIRITRKQLEELLRRVDDGKQDGGGVPVRGVISELLCVASTSSNFRHREEEEGHWRPSLQSIPE